MSTVEIWLRCLEIAARLAPHVSLTPTTTSEQAIEIAEVMYEATVGLPYIRPLTTATEIVQ